MSWHLIYCLCCSAFKGLKVLKVEVSTLRPDFYFYLKKITLRGVRVSRCRAHVHVAQFAVVWDVGQKLWKLVCLYKVSLPWPMGLAPAMCPSLRRPFSFWMNWNANGAGLPRQGGVWKFLLYIFVMWERAHYTFDRFWTRKARLEIFVTVAALLNIVLHSNCRGEKLPEELPNRAYNRFAASCAV